MIKINNKHGIHARPSSIISEITNKFESNVTIKYNDNTANGASIMELILLCIEPNAQIELMVDGTDEQEAFTELVQYLELRLISEEFE